MSDLSIMPQQSPIDIRKDDTIYAEFTPEYFRVEYANKSLSGCFEHDFYFDEPPTLIFEGVSAKLERVHIHSRSEHLLDGQDFDFEIHFVHPLQSSIPETGKQRYLVLGVFFKESEKGNTPESIRKLNEYLKFASGNLVQHADESSKGKPEINPYDFLPQDRERFFRYEGSLTTPNKDETPNAEVVSWIVFPELVLVKPEDVKELKEKALDTARRPQKIYRRFVLRSFE